MIVFGFAGALEVEAGTTGRGSAAVAGRAQARTAAEPRSRIRSDAIAHLRSGGGCLPTPYSSNPAGAEHQSIPAHLPVERPSYNAGMLATVRKLLELIRFSHTVFALPFALASAALAWKTEPFRWLDLLGILLGMVCARSAAMAFNRLVDRRIDAGNARTAQRHLPAGTLSVPLVVSFTVLTSAGFLASTLLFLLRDPPNFWPLILGGPVLLFLIGYSLAKRFTSLAHFWLGTALALAPLAAWIAIRGMVELGTPLVLGAAVLFWVAGFDILYACQDAEFDRGAGLHSVPARFGIRRSLRIAAACHGLMFALLVVLTGFSPHLGTLYLYGLIPIGLLLVCEHALVKPDDLTRVNRAFFQVNGIISFGLLALVLLDLWSGW
jgi:4-hydroxybenzoate polyprenyltransferase